MWIYNHSPELKHHGVLGMKWGVRRYQNKDGTLTAAGKRRTKTFKEKAKEHDAKTQARDKARQEKVSKAVKKVKDDLSNTNSPLVKLGKELSNKKIKRNKERAKQLIEKYGDRYTIKATEDGVYLRDGEDLWKMY